MLRRLRPLDRVLLFTLVPLWLACFGFQLRAAVHGGFPTLDFWVSSAESADSYPIVYKVIQPGSPSSSGLVTSDRLIKVGRAELRGVTTLGFFGRVYEEVDDQLRVRLEVQRGKEAREVMLQLVPYPLWWRVTPAATACVIIAILLFLRAPEWQLSRSVFLTFMLFGFASIASTFGGGLWQTYAGGVINCVSYPLMAAFAVRLASLFPQGRRRTPWELILPWCFGLGFFVWFVTTLWFPIPWPHEVNAAGFRVLWLAMAIVVIWTLTRNYVHSDPVGRRQIKSILLGVYLGLAPFGLVQMATVLGLIPEPWLRPLTLAAELALIFIPIGCLVAGIGYRFLDIDPLISAAASYSILGVAALAGLLALVPRLAEIASMAIVIEPSSAQLFLSVVLATVAIPFYRSLRPRIDRFFFPERHSLDEGIHRLLADLSDRRDPRGLTALAGEQLDTQFQPESCVVYALAGFGYEPVFARGRAVPPVVEVQSPLVTTLQARTTPLAANRFSQRDRINQLSLFDRAALDTLGAAVVVPVHQRGQLVAFLCLGPKRSGDIYTSTDLALLSAVANTVSMQLEHMDQEAVVREARAMQQDLRRYVPGAVAQQVEAGADLEPRERPVSVLFVDIRGYATYAESREAHEVFTTINRYTQTVSAIVEKFGGSVVEFNGDGMMAVFGAPDPLPDKERAVVAAGREMVATVPTVGGPEPLAVGVGIATGSAFVGSIQAVDRMIWTALGNTTNLAARLQGLTRDLDAAMVIDLATWRAAGEPPEFERREQVAIRGRSQREDLYVLSLRVESV
jgi:class 3 adenylate cyclase